MKKIFTLIFDETAETEYAVPDEIELLHTDSERTIFDVIKQAKGKYCFLCEGDLTCDLTDELFEAVNGVNADILYFDGGYCFKTSLIKSETTRDCSDCFSTQFFAVLAAKSLQKLQKFKPFESVAKKAKYCEADTAILLRALEEFRRAKPKLAKEIYSFATDLICGRLKSYYIAALLDIFEGKQSNEMLAEFDEKLKEDIVLYMTLNKRLSAVNLQKLRAKKFKVGLMSYMILKKLAKMK